MKIYGRSIRPTSTTIKNAFSLIFLPNLLIVFFTLTFLLSHLIDVLFEPVEGAGLSLENTLAEEDMYTYSGQTRVDSNGSYLHITFEKIPSGCCSGNQIP